VPGLGAGHGTVRVPNQAGPLLTLASSLYLMFVSRLDSQTCLASARGEREEAASCVEVERNQAMETPQKQSEPKSDRRATAVEETDGVSTADADSAGLLSRVGGSVNGFHLIW